MEDFDPNNPGTSDYAETDSTPLPPGRYILAAAYVGRDKKGHGKHRSKFEVIAGPGKGRTPWWNIDVGSHPRARQRLAAYCRAVGNMNRFNPGDLKQLVERFRGAPFVATLGIDSYPGKQGDTIKQNEVTAYHDPSEWTDLERQLVAEWKSEQPARPGQDDGMGGEIPQDQDGDPGPEGSDGIPF